MFASTLVVGCHLCYFVVMTMILDVFMNLVVVVVFVVVVRPHPQRLGVVVVVVPGVLSPKGSSSSVPRVLSPKRSSSLSFRPHPWRLGVVVLRPWSLMCP